MLKVTVFAASWYPRLSSRAIQNARLFAAIDQWDCNVFTLKNQSHQSIDKNISKKLEKHKVHYLEQPKPSIMQRILLKLGLGEKNIPDNLRQWAKNAFKRSLEENPEPDIILSISNPLSGHLAGLELKKNVPSAPWLVFFSDPWTHWGDVDFRKDSPEDRELNWKLEKEVVENADALLFPTVEMAKYFQEFHPVMADKPIHILPQSFEEEEEQYEAKTFSDKSRLTIRYIGSWYKERTPEKLLRVLKTFKEHYPTEYKDFQWELIGYMASKENYLQYLDDLNIVQVDPVPNHEALQLVKTADVLLHVGVPSRQDFYRPSKLVEYLSAGSPIVCLSSPGAEEKFTKSANGFFGDIFEEEDMLQALKDLHDAFKQNRLQDHIPPKEFRERFMAKSIASDLDSFTKTLLNTAV